MLAVYVDETLATGMDEFITLTNKIKEEFKSEPHECRPFLFSGGMINSHIDGVFLGKRKYAESLERLPDDF